MQIEFSRREGGWENKERSYDHQRANRVPIEIVTVNKKATEIEWARRSDRGRCWDD